MRSIIPHLSAALILTLAASASAETPPADLATDAAGQLQNVSGTGGISGQGFDVPSALEISGFPGATIMSGDTYHFQFWYRDTQSGVGRSNFSNGLSVTFP